MNRLLTVSPSPHITSGQSVSKLMYGVIISLIPAFLVTLYVFGLGALIVTCVSIASCVIAEFIIQKFFLKNRAQDK